jgi:mRNA interferase MazF
MKRGDIWVVNLEPSFGREIHKKRPVLIISDNLINKITPHAVIIPASSQVPSTIGKEMVLIGKQEGLNKNSVLMPLFIRSIDRERLIKKIGELQEEKLREVETAIKLILGIYEEEFENQY